MSAPLPSPDSLNFNGVTSDLIKEISNVAATVNELRPLSPDVLADLQKRMLEDRVYHSNAIEGNTLSLRETQVILETGAVVDVGRGREATEVLNMGAAIRSVQSWFEDRHRWSDETEFLRTHAILMHRLGDDHAGRIRVKRVMISGANHQPPNPEKLTEWMVWFWQTLASFAVSEPVALATWTHWCIARMHPFEDGNGRMARLWQDLILFGNRYTAAIIRATDRRDYYNALAQADDSEFNPLAQMIGQAVLTGLQTYLDTAREHDELKDWAQHLVGSAAEEVRERKRAEYLKWSRGMKQVCDAFQRCATQIADASDGTILVQCRPYELIEQSVWESLRSGTPAAKTWFFWLNLRKGECRVKYCFFFGTHSQQDAESEPIDPGPQTSLQISEQSGNTPAVRLDQIPDLPIGIREILVQDGQLFVRRIDPSTGQQIHDRSVSAVSLAQEFISQALLSRVR